MEKIIFKKECIYVCSWVILLYSRGWHKIANQLYCNKKKLSTLKQKISTALPTCVPENFVQARRQVGWVGITVGPALKWALGESWSPLWLLWSPLVSRPLLPPHSEPSWTSPCFLLSQAWLCSRIFPRKWAPGLNDFNPIKQNVCYQKMSKPSIFL